MRTLTLSDIEFLVFAVRWTLLLSALAFIGGGIVGMAIALMRTSQLSILRFTAIAYIRLFQGTRCCCSCSWCSSAATCWASASGRGCRPCWASA